MASTNNTTNRTIKIENISKPFVFIYQQVMWEPSPFIWKTSINISRKYNFYLVPSLLNLYVLRKKPLLQVKKKFQKVWGKYDYSNIYLFSEIGKQVFWKTEWEQNLYRDL